MYLVGALLAAVCFGASSIFEAKAARATAGGPGVDPRLLARLLRNWRFIAGVGLDTTGFVFQFLALRQLPLFVVQSAVASSLAVTALLAIRVLHEPVVGREWIAVATVILGLVMLGISSGHQGATHPGGWFDIVLAVAIVLIGAGSFAVGHLREPRRSAGLGLCAGLLFGIVALSARTITDLDPATLFSEPGLYLLAAGGIVAYLLYATALQRGAITTATSALVVGETAIPSGVGLLLLGDTSRPGFAPLAAIGFVLAVAGAVSLARFGNLTSQQSDKD